MLGYCAVCLSTICNVLNVVWLMFVATYILYYGKQQQHVLYHQIQQNTPKRERAKSLRTAEIAKRTTMATSFSQSLAQPLSRYKLLYVCECMSCMYFSSLAKWLHYLTVIANLYRLFYDAVWLPDGFRSIRHLLLLLLFLGLSAFIAIHPLIYCMCSMCCESYDTDSTHTHTHFLPLNFHQSL